MDFRTLWAIIVCWSAVSDFVDAEATDAKFHIDGKVSLRLVGEDADGNEDWFEEARIVVDGARHIGMLK